MNNAHRTHTLKTKHLIKNVIIRFNKGPTRSWKEIKKKITRPKRENRRKKNTPKKIQNKTKINFCFLFSFELNLTKKKKRFFSHRFSYRHSTFFRFLLKMICNCICWCLLASVDALLFCCLSSVEEVEYLYRFWILFCCRCCCCLWMKKEWPKEQSVVLNWNEDIFVKHVTFACIFV